MKKSLLFIILTLFSYTTSCQKNIYNTKNGFAINGYDVVSYFNNAPKKGKTEFQYTYNNINYKFSNSTNLNIFIKTPSKYIPQYGGWCAYAMGVKKYKI